MPVTYHMRIFSDATANFCTKENINLIMAKAKVTPIQPITTCKLEMTAVLPAARLTKFIPRMYKKNLNITNTYL